MNKIEEGWVFGERRDDLHKIHPCLTPFERLPPAEKRYDTQLALQTLKSFKFSLPFLMKFFVIKVGELWSFYQDDFGTGISHHHG